MSELTFQYFDELDAYFQNRLSEPERAALLERVQKEPQLREEFETFERLVQAAKAEGDRTLREQIHQQHQRAKAQGLLQKPRSRRLAVWGVAAAISLLLAAGIWWSRHQALFYSQLVAQQYDKESVPLLALLDSLEMRGFAAESQPDAQRFLNIVLLVEAGQYSDALPALERWRQQYPNDRPALFLQAMSELAIGEHTASSEKFEQLAAEPGRYRETAEFHQALALLHSRPQRSQAKTLLQGIANKPDHPYSDRAGKILAAW